jgi:hypothetical protein
MNKSFLAFLVFCSIISAQEITLSKDSLRIYNNPMMSSADGVTFTSHTSTIVALDSAFITVAQMDTAGLTAVIAAKNLQAVWTGYTPAAANYQWSMDSVSPNTYKLIINYSSGSSKPLSFSGNGATSQIFRFQIGACFYCNRLPEYPKYIKGTLRLFFSNGQVVELKLYSQDLRTGVREREVVTPSTARLGEALWRSKVNHGSSPTVNFFSISGQNITAEAMNGNLIGKSGIVVVKVTENGRSNYLKQLLAR